MKQNLFLLTLVTLLFFACGSKTDGGATAGASTDQDADAANDAQPKQVGRYKAGDVLYVYANSGLVLRDKPDQAGAKLTTVAARTKVDVIDEAPFTTAFATTEPCGLEIKGFWVKVKALGKEGYLFDGFLLKQRPISDEDTEAYWNSFSKTKSHTDEPPQEENGPNYYVYSKTEWENGVRYESSGYEGGSNSTLTLPKGMFTFQEAYIFNQFGYDPQDENPYKCKYDAAKKLVDCVSKDELAYTSVEEKPDGSIELVDSYAD